jgi:hypothetical protein
MAVRIFHQGALAELRETRHEKPFYKVKESANEEIRLDLITVNVTCGAVCIARLECDGKLIDCPFSATLADSSNDSGSIRQTHGLDRLRAFLMKTKRTPFASYHIH